MAYLEDYQMDPAGAQPLLTFSVFDDFSEDKDLTLVRADVLNRGIVDDEGLKVVQNMLDGYIRDDEYLSIDGFNNKPDTFDLDAFISRQKEKWQSEEQIDSNWKSQWRGKGRKIEPTKLMLRSYPMQGKIILDALKKINEIS